jgi:hypothetical protein
VIKLELIKLRDKDINEFKKLLNMFIY